MGDPFAQGESRDRNEIGNDPKRLNKPTANGTDSFEFIEGVTTFDEVAKHFLSRMAEITQRYYQV